MVLKYFRSGR